MRGFLKRKTHHYKENEGKKQIQLERRYKPNAFAFDILFGNLSGTEDGFERVPDFVVEVYE
ncbi:hypothetical protein CAPN002_10240 [Capnocytophaga stomatis]|nr:hypothetical protein CAPN002_10240 [Capnocytophaga stomatis]